MGATNETGDGLPFYVFESVELSASEPIANNGSLFLKIKKNGDTNLIKGLRTDISFLSGFTSL